MKDGVSVDETVWAQVVAISEGELDTKDIASK